MASGKNGFQKFIEENTKGAVNKGFLALSIAEIAQADNKLKALIKTLASMVLFKPLIAVGLAGAFNTMSKSIRALVRDTGSLQAALQKLRTIQGLHRSLAPFVGGLNAARLKVAELVAFSARAKIKLDSVGSAELTLQRFTKGAFAGTGALEILADSAAASGNSLEQAAEGAGRFVEDLREGRPIADAAEELRRMGLLTDDVARQLVELQGSGAGTIAMLEAFKGKLLEGKSALAGMSGEVTRVEERWEAAKQALQEKFGAPWTQAETENLKNWTAVLEALLPVIEEIAPFLQKLVGGFSTAASAFAKWAAQTPGVTDALSALVKIGATAIGVISAISTIGLAVWAFQSISAIGGLVAQLISFTGATGMAATAITGLGLAARIALAGTGIGLLLVLLGSAYGIYQNFTAAADAATDALERQRKAHEATNDAMEKQIRNARNLAEAHEATAKSAENMAAAYKEYQDALNQQAKARAGGFMDAFKSKILGIESTPDTSAEDARVRETEANYLKARSLHGSALKNEKAGRAGGMMDGVRPERAAADRDLEIARATVAGNHERAVSLQNLDRFAEHFERTRKIFGSDKAGIQPALEMAKADIVNNSAGPAADSLARVGLGGEAGGGHDIQKQIRDLERQYLPYLEKIAAKFHGESNDEPMGADDNPP